MEQCQSLLFLLIFLTLSRSGIFGACSEMAAADNNKRKRFAWDPSNCFQKDSGTSPCPTCRRKRADKLLEGSKVIHESLTSIEEQTQQVAQTSKNVSDHIGEIVKQSEAVLEKSKKIEAYCRWGSTK
ncbi:hypothetical protein ACFX15_044986 [Malus domestica]